jgi:predicted metal-dependent hydrolase
MDPIKRLEDSQVTDGAPSQSGGLSRQIPTRRISFEDSLKELPRHFAGNGNIVASHIIAALSTVFPPGEEFFVRSVRHFRDQIEDPVLKRQIAGFIGQEAMHGRAHRLFNERLAELGYPTRFFEKLTDRMLRFRERTMSAKSNLALTAALEHYTATLAELLMSNQDLRDAVGHPEVQNLLLWHALEESEHKAVAFDVYRAVGGTERMRRWTMNAITVGFIGHTIIQVVVSLLGDRDFYRPRLMAKQLNEVRKSPIMKGELWRRLRAYNRPGFHPDERDASDLHEFWKERLFGKDGSLTGNLVAPAA